MPRGAIIAAACVVVIGLLALVASADKMESYYKRSGAKFLTEVAAREKVYTLPSGLLFEVVQSADAAKAPKSPTLNDECEVHYAGTLRDGTKFDSSIDRGSPATFAPSQVVKGWTEALQLMREGDIWNIYLPYELAYGARGSPPRIPPYSPLVFRLELLKVKGKGKSAEEASERLKKELGKGHAEL